MQDENKHGYPFFLLQFCRVLFEKIKSVQYIVFQERDQSRSLTYIAPTLPERAAEIEPTGN